MEPPIPIDPPLPLRLPIPISSREPPLPHSSSPIPPPSESASSERASLTQKTQAHLDIFFRRAVDGRGRHCRICLVFIPHPPTSSPSSPTSSSSSSSPPPTSLPLDSPNIRDIRDTLLAHALHAHPAECALFAAASAGELEAARGRWRVRGGSLWGESRMG
ncbi:hypothetical protein C8R47DRAFT_1101793 [Mycena vitilis]|nr:hypothetical protein C8R47DRAFT_1101793 [Mycena vitilis]